MPKKKFFEKKVLQNYMINFFVNCDIPFTQPLRSSHQNFTRLISWIVIILPCLWARILSPSANNEWLAVNSCSYQLFLSTSLLRKPLHDCLLKTSYITTVVSIIILISSFACENIDKKILASVVRRLSFFYRFAIKYR